jgi:sialidase-1
MQLIETGTLYANPNPLLVSRQAAFPGLVRLPDGDIVAMFSIGQAFDAADMRAHICRSSDDGRTWSAPRPLHQATFSPEESESFKPTLLADGTLLATGYVFLRPTPLTPIVDPDTDALLPLHNKLVRSRDGGRTWTVPQRFAVGDVGLELSGPVVQRASGELLGAAAPFHLGASGHEGWLISSMDAGATWQRRSTFSRADPDGAIAPWESRLIDFGGARMGVLFWAYDVANGRHLSNRLALSSNSGASFRTIDTGIAAQASNGLALAPDELLTIHAHREATVGLNVYRLRLAGDRLERLDTLALFADERLGQGVALADPFANLRFGQPSLLQLADGQFLACCWRVETCQHVIKTFRIRL